MKNAEQSAEKVAQDLKEEGYQGQKVTLVSTTAHGLIARA